MSQIIQIKRTQADVGTKKLFKGEMAYSSYDDKLYIGRPDDSVVGNILGIDPPVVIGGEAYTKMITPSVSEASAGSIKLGDSGKFDQENPDDDTQKYITISAPIVLDENADSYEVVLPDVIGAQDQVLSITNDTTNASSANLGWIDVTSTIEGADDSLVTTPTNGQVLIYTTDMDGPLLSYTIHDSPSTDTQITAPNALSGGWSLDAAGTIPVVGNEANGIAVYLQMGTEPGWINKSLSGAVTIDSDGITSITGTGSQVVKDFIESGDQLILGGDLIVKGDTTHVNSTVVAIQDKSLALGIQGGMSSGNAIESAVDSAEVSVTVPTSITDEIAADDYIYVGENTNGIPAGSYKVKTSANGTITFDVPELVETEILSTAAKTIAVSAKPVTDVLANDAGIIIPGGEKGSKSILFNSSDDSFVSNQSLDIVSDTSQPSAVDEVRTQTISVDGEEIAEVIQTWDATLNDGAGGVVETVTIGSDTTAWDGIEISAVKGGTGLTSTVKGDVLISPDTNKWEALSGLGTVESVNLKIVTTITGGATDEILLSDAVGAGLFTTDGDAVTGDTTADGTVEAVTYTNNLLNAPGLESEIALGNFPAAPTGAFLSLGHDHSFSWETRIDGGEF